MPPLQTNAQPAPTVAGGAQLHRFLGAGLSVVAAVFVAMTYLGAAPLLAAEGATLPVTYGLPAVSCAIVAVALFVIRPRVPDRTSMETPDEYWARPEVGTNVVLLWFMVEGAGMLAAVGYLLAGGPPATLAMALAIVVYWWCRPGLFLKG
jgi:hypothetical protein